ncbi:putative Heavy-metal-associated domain (N-terminus) and membrane-bounded cytochrome biogenesis cycZ-like domain, membrane copper tolerance protein [Vibrio aestuarianus]|nr:putative Heavy-metal-associated domain (N-terminus) and membrane-bounded cytochrome biogenesis cycZ-like domain, membrane copper tolerance protein [Vibrio aestuarianus]
MTPDWIGAFAIGLLGAGHCMGMCGGIASLLTLGQTKNARLPVLLLFYNCGRIVSYMLIGGLLGGFAASMSELSMLNHSLIWLRLIAACLMIVLGLYVGRWWFGLLKLEKMGQQLWRIISPLGKSLLPLKKSWYAVPFGFIWGWLPCGLVYSVLTWSVVSGSALSGAFVMGAFGLGTLPAMLLVGYGAHQLEKIQQSTIFRHFAAIFIISYGLYTAYSAVSILSSTW